MTIKNVIRPHISNLFLRNKVDVIAWGSSKKDSWSKISNLNLKTLRKIFS